MTTLIANSDRLSALVSFVKQYDQDVVSLFYSKVKPTSLWVDHCFSDCQDSALELFHTLFAMADRFLDSDDMLELIERLKLWELHIEVAHEMASDDLSQYWDHYDSAHDSFQDTYAMYRNEY